MGRRTYQPALNAGILSPYPHLRQIVFSTSLVSGARDIEVVNGSPDEFLRQLKKTDGRGIWLAGGGRLAAELSTEIDELVIKRNPIVLGTGVPLYNGSFAPQQLKRTSSRTFDTGVVVEVYCKPD